VTTLRITGRSGLRLATTWNRVWRSSTQPGEQVVGVTRVVRTHGICLKSWSAGRASRGDGRIDERARHASAAIPAPDV